MARQDIKQLKSKDSDERKRAIRAVAKAVDRNALKQLAVMAGDDPDPKIRKLAQQAGVYIRQKSGEIPANGNGTGDQAGAEAIKPGDYVVDERDLKQSKRLMEVAMTANMQGENARAIMLIAKAKSLNPNLVVDSYFISLAEQTTGLEGQAAIDALNDEGIVEKKEAAEASQKHQKAVDEHHAELEKKGWRDAFFNLGIVSVIAFVGAFFVGFIAVQTAQGFWDSYLQNQEDVALAEREGRYYIVDNQQQFRMVDDQPYPVYLVAGQEIEPGTRPDTFTDMRATFNTNADYWSINEYWRERSLVDLLVWALAAGIGIPLAIMLMASITHDVASWALRGDGDRAYYMEGIAGLMINRVLLLAFLCFAISLIYFGSGNSAIIFLGVIGIYGGLVLLTLFGLTSKSYRFGIAQAAIAASIGALVAGGTGFAAVYFLL